MTTYQGFEVDGQVLRAHSGTVDGVADDVDQCRRAAASVQLGRDAYGRLCQLIPSLIDPIQQSTIDTLNEATDALQRTADGLRLTARAYEGGDQAVAARFARGAEQ